MNSFTFHITKKEDFSSAFALMKNEMGAGYAEEFVEEFHLCLKRKKYYGTVCRMSTGKFVGFVSWRKKMEVAYMETIIIEPEYRRKGIGSMFLKMVEKEAYNEKAALLNVVTDAENNNEVIQFYLKKLLVSFSFNI